MARIVCSVPPTYPENEDQGYAISALMDACKEAGVPFRTMDDTDGMPRGYRGMFVMVDREQFGRILHEIANNHDEANLADSYALLDCEFDTSGMFAHQRMLFYEIEGGA